MSQFFSRKPPGFARKISCPPPARRSFSFEHLESRRFLSAAAAATPASKPFGASPAPIPGIIQAENFDNGGEGIAYHDTTTANEGGAYRATGVDLEAAGDTGGGFNVGWTRAGEWLTYTVTVSTAGKYDLTARVASQATGGTFHVSFAGIDKTGALAIPATGAWQTYTNVTAPSLALAAGTYVMRIDVTGGGPSGFAGNFNWFNLTAASTPTTPPPVVPPPMEHAHNILFFGNSFTANNNLSSIVADLAAADGHMRPNVYVQAINGWTLSDHLAKLAADGSNNIIVHSLPTGTTWDDVVIQDFSTRPTNVTAAPVNGNQSGFRADASALLRQVHAHSPGVHAVFFETWARGADNSTFYPSPYSSPAAMQDDLLTNYSGAVWDANHAYPTASANLAAVGEAWRARNFSRDLYDGPDEYHPSYRGSLLAALLVYRATYHENTRDISEAKVDPALTANGLTAADWASLTALADATNQ